MNNFESVVILTPLLSEEATKELIGKFRSYLTDNGAEIIHEESGGWKKLAYPIKKKTPGYYHVNECKATGELSGQIDVAYKREERIMRFLTISTHKPGVAHTERENTGKK